MSASLRDDYLALLKAHGVRPFKVPSNAREIRIQVLEHKIATCDDEEITAIYQARLDEERAGTAPDDDRPPGQLMLDHYNGHIEKALLRSAAHASRYQRNVYAGEFPTGSVNAEACRTQNGYLILVNAGLQFLIQQITETLSQHDEVQQVLESEESITMLAEIVVKYLRNGDPVYGPTPLNAGVRAMVSHLLSSSCCEFVVAHEYGHILAGHLDAATGSARALETPVGPVEVINSSWAQEFEADRIGYELTLGGKDASEVDLAIIDRWEADKLLPEDRNATPGVDKLIAALTAPLYFFQIDVLLTTVWSAIQQDEPKARVSHTHPPSRMRMHKLMDAFEWIPRNYMRLVRYPWALGEVTEPTAVRARELVRSGRL